MSNKETKAKVANAFRAMKAIGISEDKVKPVLKSLLKLYDKNWALIEEENYRALADAIFEREESEAQERARKIANSEAAEQSKRILNTQAEDRLEEETQAAEEPERPLKRLRLRHRDGQSSSLNTSDNGTIRTPLVRPKEEPDETIVPLINGSIGTAKSPQPRDENTRSPTQAVILPSQSRDKGKQPVSAEPLTINERCDISHPSSTSKNKQKARLETEPRHPMRLRDRRPGVVSPQITHKEKRPVPESSARALCLKEPKVEPDVPLSPDKKCTSNHALVKPKDEPVTEDMPCLEAPSVGHTDVLRGGDSSSQHDLLPDPSGLQYLGEKETADGTTTLNQTTSNIDLPMTSVECSSNIEIASSPEGEVKIYLRSTLAAGRSDFHMPSLDEVLKFAEDKCFRSPKSLDPNISLMNIMKEICRCILELGTNSNGQSPKTVDISPTTDSVRNCSASDGQGVHRWCTNSFKSLSDSQSGGGATLPESQTPLPPCTSTNDGTQVHINAADDIMTTRENEDHCAQEITGLSLEAVQQPPATPCNNMDNGAQQNKADAGGERVKHSENQENFVQETNDQRLEAVQLSQPTSGIIKLIHHAVDIAKGQEKVIITLVNEVNDESPPSFHYIPQNAAFQNAYVNFSLARIGDKNCCATCSVDCLSSSTPCACAHESGGEFAYTSDGLVKEELLKECISMNRDPKKHCQYFCKECPLERSKCADIIEPCKGHVVRKFIKECWWKCGCNKQCGNRVVQRGITHNLQVFMTPGGKGWGLRTLEDLPKGAFVCEYVGEVLTNAELFDRVLKSPEGEKHSYPVLLDADWCAEAVLKDEEALCLDATYYGNVARFINHRCYDSNLVEIPVEVETPDHHYYHLAFFTTRKVKAMEELTWDYGIDFDDHEHPIKAFRCQCGSKFCRNIKRSRSRSSRR